MDSSIMPNSLDTHTHRQMSFSLNRHQGVSLYKQQGSLSDPLRGQGSGSQPGVAMVMASGELKQSGISSACQTVHAHTHTHTHTRSCLGPLGL